jgi:hypothetical protein
MRSAVGESDSPRSLTTEYGDLESSQTMFSTGEVRTVVKLLRANGGCLGAGKRRRTWQAAISLGEPQAGCDPGMSEWGNLGGVMSARPVLNT